MPTLKLARLVIKKKVLDLLLFLKLKQDTNYYETTMYIKLKTNIETSHVILYYTIITISVKR